MYAGSVRPIYTMIQSIVDVKYYLFLVRRENMTILIMITKEENIKRKLDIKNGMTKMNRILKDRDTCTSKTAFEEEEENQYSVRIIANNEGISAEGTHDIKELENLAGVTPYADKYALPIDAI